MSRVQQIHARKNVQLSQVFHGTRFMVVGWLGTGVNSLCLYVLKGRFHVPIIPASIMATEVAIIHNFIWLRYWAWGDRRPHNRSRILRQLVVYNISTGVVDLLVNVPLLWLLYKLAGIPYLLANLAGMLVGPLIKFGLNDKFVFKEVRDATEQHPSAAPCQSDFPRPA
jgi:dolichol-phosphate mannosyltransferase